MATHHTTLRQRTLGISCVSVFLWALPLGSQPVPTGPAVGARVPDFSANDQTGRVQSLKTLMGPKGLLLVFYRSADW